MPKFAYSQSWECYTQDLPPDTGVQVFDAGICNGILNGTRGVKTVDVSGFKAGAYLYRLSGKTGTMESGILIIK
jgi:hypothetical protein